MSAADTRPTFANEGPEGAMLDEKGRVAIPAPYVREVKRFIDMDRRDAPPGDVEELYVFVTLGQDESLYIYPPSEWTRHVAALEQRVEQNPDDLELEDYRDATVGLAKKAILDTQNRIKIPDELIEMAGLERKRKVTFMALPRYLRVFDEQRSKQFAREALVNFRKSRANRHRAAG